jgi:hypothetical protein
MAGVSVVQQNVREAFAIYGGMWFAGYNRGE